MINLETFFKNHFDTKDISDDNLKLFTEVNLQRMAANNPGGIYSTLITNTTTAYTNYFGDISNEDVKSAIQQGLTITMNNAKNDFITNLRQKEGLVKSIWGKTSEEYQEFFPHGLEEYNQMNLANAATLINRIVTAASAHSADVGTPFVNLFTGLQTTFTNARTAQLTTIGQVKGLKINTAGTRDAVEVQLMTNVLTIALNNIGHPEVVAEYFDQSIVRGKPQGTSTKTAELDVASGAIGNFNLSALGINFEKVISITFESHLSDGQFYAGETETSPPGATSVNVPADESAERSAEDAQTQLGADSTHTKINVKNTGSVAGHYKITFTVEK